MTSKNKVFEIKKFDMKKIKFAPDEKEGPVIFMVGKRGTGKSFLVEDLLYYHQNIPVGACISATEESNGFYSKIIPKLFIHYEYSENIIANVLKRQKMIVKQIKKEIKLYKKSSIDGRSFVILDDCLYDNAWSRDKLMKLIFMNGRHWKIMLIVTMQYPMGVPPNLRTNIDYTFILRETNLSNRRRIYENYAGVFPTFDSFCNILDQCTNGYECLVVDNTVRSNKLQDQIFWYKAQNHEQFKICNQEFWELSKNLPSDDEDEDYDPNNDRPKKQNFKVKKSNIY